MRLSLVFAIPEPERASPLEQGLHCRPELTVRPVRLREVQSDVDAVYLPIMAAERWGAANRLLIHRAQVFKTRPEDRAAGWPRFVIAGLPLREGEDAFDSGLAPLVIKAAIVAARRFNGQGNEVIESIGFETGWTLIDGWPPLEAAQMICAAYDEAMAVPDDELDEYGRVKPHIIASVEFIGARGGKVSTELRCLLEFQGKRYECALILDEIGRLGIGGNEGVPIEFLSPEISRPRLNVGDRFVLREGRRRIADGVVEQVFPVT